jgi:hypothetical protein
MKKNVCLSVCPPPTKCNPTWQFFKKQGKKPFQKLYVQFSRIHHMLKMTFKYSFLILIMKNLKDFGKDKFPEEFIEDTVLRANAQCKYIIQNAQ